MLSVFTLSTKRIKTYWQISLKYHCTLAKVTTHTSRVNLSTYRRPSKCCHISKFDSAYSNILIALPNINPKYICSKDTHQISECGANYLSPSFYESVNYNAIPICISSVKSTHQFRSFDYIHRSDIGFLLMFIGHRIDHQWEKRPIHITQINFVNEYLHFLAKW